MVDFRSHAVGSDFEGRKRDRQLEASRARAAGINIKDVVDPLNLRYVGMAGNDHIDTGANIDVQRLQVVQNVDRLSREPHDFRLGVFACPNTSVDISSDGGDGRDPAKRIDDFGPTDIAGMNDVIDAR